MQTERETLIESCLKQLLFIAEVDYDEENRNIAEVEIVSFYKDKPETTSIPRRDVVALLKDKFRIWTIGVTKQGRPCFANVIMHPVNGEEYIMTTANDEPCDNLGNLPSITR